MRDEDGRSPFVREALYDLEERFDLLWREHSRWLIQNQQARIAVEQLEDLDALAYANGEFLHALGRVDFQPELLRKLAHALDDGRAVDEEAARWFQAEGHVLGHCERRDELEMLVHHADAQIDRRLWVRDVDRLALEQDFAAIRMLQPVKDAHERRFTGAIFADKGVNFTRLDSQIDRIVGEDAGVCFVDLAQLEVARVSGHGHPERLIVSE